MSTVGDVQYRGGKSSLSSIQWTPPALYGASYMYGTHHLNNYHHNSKSISIMWGFVWYSFKKGVFGQLPLYRHCSRPCGYHIGPTCTSVFGQLPHCHHYSRPCGHCVELHMRPTWKVFGVASTLSSLDQTPRGIMRLHMGPT